MPEIDNIQLIPKDLITESHTPSAADQQTWVDNNTFPCQKLNAQISRTQCKINQRRVSTYIKCKSCPISTVPDNFDIQHKTCKAHRILPEACSCKDGIFYRDEKNTHQIWSRRLYGSPKCQRTLTKMLQSGKYKYNSKSKIGF